MSRSSEVLATLHIGSLAGRGALRNFEAAFVEIDKFKHRLNSAGRQAEFGEAFVQALGAGVAPAPFHHERIPDFDVFLGGAAAVHEGPVEEFFISTSWESFLFQSGVVDLQKPAAACIERSFF